MIRGLRETRREKVPQNSLRRRLYSESAIGEVSKMAFEEVLLNVTNRMSSEILRNELQRGGSWCTRWLKN